MRKGERKKRQGKERRLQEAALTKQTLCCVNSERERDDALGQIDDGIWLVCTGLYYPVKE